VARSEVSRQCLIYKFPFVHCEYELFEREGRRHRGEEGGRKKEGEKMEWGEERVIRGKRTKFTLVWIVVYNQFLGSNI
jgi:hypothetical protein